ncbi:MAG TPA: response regulator [bacterium]|nr:response regulator [bacterium]
MKILIAEDDAVSRRLLERKLLTWGYQVVACSNGLDAWKALEQDDAPHLAILNWMMPGMDGVQICREVRKQQRKHYTYMILLTARDQKEDIVEGIEAGADDYVTKPFNPHELNVRVRAGKRVLEMHDELFQREKLRGVVEMAGATCHEFNQPMQVISGYAELLLKQIPETSPLHAKVVKIKEATEVMAQITGKLQQITRYETREYFDGIKIIDIDKSSQAEAKTGPSGEGGEGGERGGGVAAEGADQAKSETAAPLPTCGWTR